MKGPGSPKLPGRTPQAIFMCFLMLLDSILVPLAAILGCIVDKTDAFPKLHLWLASLRCVLCVVRVALARGPPGRRKKGRRDSRKDDNFPYILEPLLDFLFLDFSNTVLQSAGF